MNSPNNERLWIGLVGDAASGKDLVAARFVEKGFIHFSTSEVVREKIYQSGLTPSRRLQTIVANQYRSKHGPTYFVQEAIRRLPCTEIRDKVVLSGLYSPAEGEYLKENLGGYLIRVCCSKTDSDDSTMRFRRLSVRADGTRDDMGIKDFEDAYTFENSGVLPCEANVSVLMRNSDYAIINDKFTTKESISQQIDTIIESLSVA